MALMHVIYPKTRSYFIAMSVTAMVELVKEAKQTLLSYHCHSLVPVGVSCIGVLLESHISLHTW